MVKKLTAAILGIFMIGLYGCKIQTPEIRGVVIDAETNQPVPEAWIFATLVVETQTVQGGVTTYIALEEPHTRSNEKGEFIIPAREIKIRFSPYESAARVKELSAGAETIDDRFGRFPLREYEGRERLDIILKIRPVERKEDDYYHHIKNLYYDCLMGRRGITIPIRRDGCDEWELNYAITKHERFLSRLEEPNTIDRETYYAHTMRQLAFLYRKKGDYKKALDLYMKIREFDKNRNVDLYLKRYEVEIRELKELLMDGKNQ